jgi:hypothetical protein
MSSSPSTAKRKEGRKEGGRKEGRNPEKPPQTRECLRRHED